MPLEIVIPGKKPKWRCPLCRTQLFYEHEERLIKPHMDKCTAEHHEELQDRRDRREAFRTLEGKADIERENALAEEIRRDILRGRL